LFRSHPLSLLTRNPRYDLIDPMTRVMLHRPERVVRADFDMVRIEEREEALVFGVVDDIRVELDL
jgi:hypothetical protein